MVENKSLVAGGRAGTGVTLEGEGEEGPCHDGNACVLGETDGQAGDGNLSVGPRAESAEPGSSLHLS